MKLLSLKSTLHVAGGVLNVVSAADADVLREKANVADKVNAFTHSVLEKTNNAQAMANNAQATANAAQVEAQSAQEMNDKLTQAILS